MGPRSLNRGNAPERRFTASLKPASMGPRSLNRGNEWSGEAAFETAPLQWGRGLSTAEITWPTHTDRISAGFNGAAVSQPRKSACHGACGRAVAEKLTTK